MRACVLIVLASMREREREVGVAKEREGGRGREGGRARHKEQLSLTI